MKLDWDDPNFRWWHIYRRKVTRWEFDNARLGADRRHFREKFGISLRTFAKKMGVSAVYVSDLERGLRPWSEQLIHRFEHTLFELTDKPTEELAVMVANAQQRNRRAS